MKFLGDQASQKGTKKKQKRYVYGSWKKDEVYRFTERGYEMEMRVEDKKKKR